MSWEHTDLLQLHECFSVTYDVHASGAASPKYFCDRRLVAQACCFLSSWCGACVKWTARQFYSWRPVFPQLIWPEAFIQFWRLPWSPVSKTHINILGELLYRRGVAGAGMLLAGLRDVARYTLTLASCRLACALLRSMSWLWRLAWSHCLRAVWGIFTTKPRLFVNPNASWKLKNIHFK